MINKRKARISLEFLIGVIISIFLIVIVLNLIFKISGLNEESKQSFYKFVELVKEVKKDPSGTIKSTSLRIDKETVIIGFPKNNEPLKFDVSEASNFAPGFKTLLFEKPISEEKCEKNKACLCLCRKIEDSTKDGKIRCKENYLICEIIDDVDFPEYLPPEEGPLTYFSRTNGFFISRSKIFKHWKNSQFRTIYVEKYESAEKKIVSVCESPIDDSCMDHSYKMGLDAIEGMKKLKEYIESCAEKKMPEGEQFCSCGGFDFISDIPSKYYIEFTESENQKLEFLLKNNNKNDIIESVEVNTALCTYQPKLKDSEDLPKDKEIIISQETPAYYTHYKGNDEDYSFIVFVKNNEGNTCILRTSERGYLGVYEDYPEMITFKSTIRKERRTTLGHEEINITGCETKN